MDRRTALKTLGLAALLPSPLAALGDSSDKPDPYGGALHVGHGGGRRILPGDGLTGGGPMPEPGDLLYPDGTPFRIGDPSADAIVQMQDGALRWVRPGWVESAW